MDCGGCSTLCVPEDRFGMYVRYCVNDHLWKTAAGLLAGYFVAKFTTKPSRVTCKRKTWPILLGLGIGLGLASEYCKREFSYALSDKRRKRRLRNRKKHALNNWTEPCS